MSMVHREVDVDAVTQLIAQVAREAVMPKFRALRDDEVHHKPTPGHVDDIVTEADRRAEAQLTEGLLSLMPSACVVAEEAAHTNPALVGLVHGDRPAWLRSILACMRERQERPARIEIQNQLRAVSSDDPNGLELLRQLQNGVRRPAVSPKPASSDPTVVSGPDWNADIDFDVRLQDVPLTNRRPDVVVYRADTIDVTPTRPEHVLLVAEIVSPGSETTDRIVKHDQYARAGIEFYWRVELTATGIPVVYSYLLDSASSRYRDGEVFTGLIKATVPFQVEIDLSGSW